jgi:protoheme IX farnesyltransferase
MEQNQGGEHQREKRRTWLCAEGLKASMKGFSRLVAQAVVATYVLIVLGGLVRASGAGLACPDWPLCHGRLIPPSDPLVLIEWSHRFVAAVVALLTVALAISAWRLRREHKGLIPGLGLLALGLVVVQVGLGALTVRRELVAWIVVAHLGAAMGFFATLIVLAITVMVRQPAARRRDPFRTLAICTVAVTYLLVLIGGYVSASGAGLACPDWPLCYGQLVPSLTGDVGAHLLHRFAALLTGVLIAVTAAAAYRTQTRRPALQAASAIALGLLILQMILGGLNIEYRLAEAVTVAHLATAAALFATLVVLAVLAHALPESEAYQPEFAGKPGRPRVQRVMDYVALTKPRIIVLLLVTAFASMLVAAPGRTSPWLIVFTLAGGAMSAGAANAINQLLERDIDALMTRTRQRPIPSGRVAAPYAFAFAVLLGTVAFVEMASLVNLLAATLSFAALLFYVFVYTVWLKRSTPQNIVIGGAAGAVPPLVGWAAATGRVDPTAAVLFLIVFLWTPPHFWALALFRRDDYARAQVPMLPVVSGEGETRRQILIYTVVLTLSTLLLVPVGRMGLVYGVSAAVLGGLFVALAVRLWRQRTPTAAMRVFGYSIVYLAVLFTAMVVDRLLQV